jgi:hypothetical protein
VRQKLTSPNVENLEKNMKSYEKIIEQKLKTSVNVNYIFPWKRLFEVEIEFN